MQTDRSVLEATHIAWIETVVNKKLDSVAIIGLRAEEGDEKARELAQSTAKAMSSLGGCECYVLKISQVGENVMIIEEN